MSKEEYDRIMKKCHSLKSIQEQLDYLNNVIPVYDFYPSGYEDKLIEYRNKLAEELHKRNGSGTTDDLR